MRMTWKLASGLLAAALLAGSTCNAADVYGLEKGNPDLKSAGQLAFGPDGILFVGDAKGGAVFAIQTGDKQGDAAQAKYDIAGLNVKLAETLGANSQQVEVADLAVNPQSGNVYLSINAGKPAIVRVSGDGKLSKVSLEGVAFARAALPDAPEDKVTGEGRRARNKRNESITDLAFVDGVLLVSGYSNAQAPSAVRQIPFPFNELNQGASIEIFHAAHGGVEDDAVVRTFIPFNIGGEPNVLAGFTCTPLVRFPLSKLQPGAKVRGTTVAELGNRNRPLDMIAYKQGGKDFLLLTNSSRGVMKVGTDSLSDANVTEPVKGGGTAGQQYETVEDWKGVVQLDKLNEEQAVIIAQNESGAMDLKSVPLP